MSELQTIVFKPRPDEVIVTSNGRIPQNIFQDLGFRIPTLVKMSTALAGHTMTNTTPVVFLNKKELFTPGLVTRHGYPPPAASTTQCHLVTICSVPKPTENRSITSRDLCTNSYEFNQSQSSSRDASDPMNICANKYIYFSFKQK